MSKNPNEVGDAELVLTERILLATEIADYMRPFGVTKREEAVSKGRSSGFSESDSRHFQTEDYNGMVTVVYKNDDGNPERITGKVILMSGHLNDQYVSFGYSTESNHGFTNDPNMDEGIETISPEKNDRIVRALGAVAAQLRGEQALIVQGGKAGEEILRSNIDRQKASQFAAREASRVELTRPPVDYECIAEICGPETSPNIVDPIEQNNK